MPTRRTSLPRRVAWTAWLAANAPLQARFAFRSPEAIERAQRRRLRATIRHAYEHVPYYRETMRRLGLGPGDLRTFDDLGKLPLVERDELQRDPERFVSDRWPLDTHLILRSGGSTGEPVKVFRHPRALFEGGAYRERARAPMMKLAGRRVRVRLALIALPGIEGAKEEFGRRTLIPSSVRVARARFSMLTPPAEMVAALNEVRPDVIVAHGSYLEALFQHLATSGDHLERPKVVAYSSDGMSEQSRQLIAERFGIDVLSVYRAVEAPQIGFECERHTGHHVNVDLCPIRIVDDDGADVPAGELGEVVASNLYGQGTVLLNYRLRDRAALLPGPCPCGRNLPLMSMVHGRTDEWLVGPDGRPLHSQLVRAAMRHRDDLLRYRIVQVEPARFHAALVVLPETDRADMAGYVERELRELFGKETVVEATFPDDLERTAGGKVVPVTSLVGAR